ncbi:ankyrin repeat protein, putative [Trichomonas vaginalis G3]|uniref:Ankyrin repeat protein, putative n=1 Tax=Trichomonas vaginalis (strain ATCC PRA-98 / G3) TaxID=412133 RepID=A2DJZ2_TRIV3|nr:ankyrin repeat and SOCS box-containing protein 4 family [Trichomonas vaginalis G3]EAY19356.1 ankyrin repeat protein, putative [Trichomonas vaginalis G3]KAI5527264.1 ankyrin repeat and SOCS box-containing protein 4 family [Trichomonas vaginalis G3]|eukprot:XP_001580342.1 ankyrin repeat protein [Trichomonas vaginalis G3]
MGSPYDDAIDMCRDFHDAYCELYRVKTTDGEEINRIFNHIKYTLIERYKVPPAAIISKISNCISIYNNRYLNSYWSLIKKIYDDSKCEIYDISTEFDFFFYKEYGFVFNSETENWIKHFERKRLSPNMHDADPMFRAIMNDDLKIFIDLSEKSSFHPNISIRLTLYPSNDGREYSLLELCSYHGAASCFKFLRSKYNSLITQTCLRFSFLGGNPEIISECLKKIRPKEKCMEYAIISHNIDFITFLMNEYNLIINLDHCILHNNIQAFLVYLDQTKDINSCLVASPAFNLPPLVEHLISKCNDINATNIDGKMALHIATECGSMKTIKILISHGADVNAKDMNGRTALHIASRKNYDKIAKFLVSHNADVNLKDKNGKSALYYAIMSNYKEIAKILIAHGSNFDEKNGEGKNFLHIALEHYQAEISNFLINHGVDINQKDNNGYSPLHYIAASNSMHSVMELLISKGADINAQDNNGKTSLHLAASKEHSIIVEYLITNMADLNLKDYSGKTPLHYAAMNEITNSLKLIISHGADLNSKDNMGKVALHYAVLNNRKNAAELLILHGININETDNIGKTALHYAVVNNNIGLVELIASNKADVNLTDNYGKTALHYAAAKQNQEIVKFLILHDADITIRDFYRKTASNYAKKANLFNF